MDNLKNRLFSVAQVRACERKAIDTLDISELELMQRAGKALLHSIKKFFPEAQTIAIFCGAGNNAGDGYVLAKLAYLHGLSVIIYQCKNINDLSTTVGATVVRHSSSCRSSHTIVPV